MVGFGKADAISLHIVGNRSAYRLAFQHDCEQREVGHVFLVYRHACHPANHPHGNSLPIWNAYDGNWIRYIELSVGTGVALFYQTTNGIWDNDVLQRYDSVCLDCLGRHGSYPLSYIVYRKSLDALNQQSHYCGSTLLYRHENGSCKNT